MQKVSCQAKTSTWRCQITAKLFFVSLLILLMSSVVWAGAATDQLKTTLGQIIQVLNDSSLKANNRVNERKNILMKLVRERIDEEEFSRKVLGAYWQDRTEAEKQEFIETFRELLERTYFERLDTYLAKSETFSEENIHYIKEKVKGKYAVVVTEISVGEDSRLPVHYRFINRKDNWLICDIAIEGVSLAKNYRAQFSEIIANSSFEELIKRLKNKQKKENITKKN
jgi:phospholipid transport system substrate-binding protein